MHTVEPPIGNLKHNLGYRYFLLRGTNKVSGEFNLMCTAHNLKKIHKKISGKKKKGLAVALLKVQKTRKIGGKNWIEEKKNRLSQPPLTKKLFFVDNSMRLF